jgi:MATE family multidrug resistance protein
VPLIGGQLAAFGGNTVDVLLAGHLGARVLGAVAIGTNVFSLAIMTIVGVMMAMPPSVAQLDGAGRRGEAAALFRQAVWLGLGLGVVLQQALWWGGPLLIGAIGIDAGLAAEADAFVRAASFGLPGFGLFSACRGLTDGASRPRVTLAFTLANLVLLVPIGYALMYGAGPIPPLGALGCGIATAIVLTGMPLAFAVFLRTSPRFADFGWHAGPHRPSPGAIRAFLRVGAPMAVAVLLEVGLFNSAALVIGGFGDVAIASHQIALNVASMSFMVPLGLAMAITVRVGNAVGRGDRAGVRRAGLAGILLVLLTQSLSCTIMLALPATIARIYSSDAAVRAGAVTLLYLAGAFQFSDGIQVAAAGALRGLKDTRVPMLITALAYWGAGMPVGWLLAVRAGFAAPGMWVGLITGLTTAAVLLFLRFERLSRVRVVRA